MKRSDFDPDRYQSAEKLKVDKNFTPCSVVQGDEKYIIDGHHRMEKARRL
ncbi:MAG: hypothetical protein K9N10_22300 [Deltaproteobacteria bacterium]|nr:hypothetical protein [Deltaproteobacteria bacterium]